MPPRSTLVLLGSAVEPARGALVEVDGPARLGVDAADSDVDVRAAVSVWAALTA